MERRRTSFVYHAWALTTYFEAFVLLVAALAPFTSFAARTARPLADYQRWNSCKGACNRDTARNLIGKLLNTLKGHEDVLSKRAQHEGVMGENGVYPSLRDDATALELETPSLM